MAVGRRRDDEDGWRFDENPAGDALYDAGYESSGVGQWSTASSKKLKTNENTEDTMNAQGQKKPLGPTDVLTPTFRASYPTLFEARAPDPKKPNEKNFGVEMWFRIRHTPESQAAHEELVNIADLEKAAMAACSEAWGPDKTKWPAGFKHPFKVGDTMGGKNGPVPGVMIVRTNRKESFGRPAVVDQNVKDIIDKNQIYAGCYCRAKIHAYIWKHPTGGQGVSFTLDMIQLVRDGEPLGNKLAPEDAFDAIPVPAGQPAGAAGGSTPPAGGSFGSFS